VAARPPAGFSGIVPGGHFSMATVWHDAGHRRQSRTRARGAVGKWQRFSATPRGAKIVGHRIRPKQKNTPASEHDSNANPSHANDAPNVLRFCPRFVLSGMADYWHDPTPAQIEAACLKIQAGWSPLDRWLRSDGRDLDSSLLARFEGFDPRQHCQPVLAIGALDGRVRR
jgi:hypothetical protein